MTGEARKCKRWKLIKWIYTIENMVSEVLKGLYMISLPFMRRRVKSIDEIKLYLIKGKVRNLLIDTGLNESEYFELVLKDFNELGISMENTDIFLTRMHPDHSGLPVAGI